MTLKVSGEVLRTLLVLSEASSRNAPRSGSLWFRSSERNTQGHGGDVLEVKKDIQGGGRKEVTEWSSDKQEGRSFGSLCTPA